MFYVFREFYLLENPDQRNPYPRKQHQQEHYFPYHRVDRLEQRKSDNGEI